MPDGQEYSTIWCTSVAVLVQRSGRNYCGACGCVPMVRRNDKVTEEFALVERWTRERFQQLPPTKQSIKIRHVPVYEIVRCTTLTFFRVRTPSEGHKKRRFGCQCQHFRTFLKASIAYRRKLNNTLLTPKTRMYEMSFVRVCAGSLPSIPNSSALKAMAACWCCTVQST